jgi:hypothetical protein
MPAPIRIPPQAIVNALLKWRGNVVAAAGEVGMAPNSMYERIDRMGLDLAALRNSGAGPVTPITGNKGQGGDPVSGFAGGRASAQKKPAQAGPIFPAAGRERRLGGVMASATTDEAAEVPIKTAPKRHQPLRLRPDLREALQRAAWQLQAHFQVATDENLILEQLVEESLAPFVQSKLEPASPARRKKADKNGGGTVE